MKILLPCPGCQRPLTPPRHASSTAQLRCSMCGHTLTAESILVDSGPLNGTWEVVEDPGTDNAFAALFLSDSDTFSDANESDRFRDVGVDDVPPSNEWETQSSSIVFEEPLETDAEYQISNEFRSSEVGNLGEIAELESEAMPDQMIGVSDEPWFSPMEHPQDVEYPRHDDETADDSLEGMLDPVEEPSAIEFESEAALMLDENEDASLATDEFLDAEVSELEIEEEEPEELDLVEEVDVEMAPLPTEIVRRTPQLLPNELLGNSKTVLRSRKKSNPVGTLLSVVGGGVAAIPISILLMWYVLGKDPLDAGPLVANLAPWVVPEQFRGSVAGTTDTLPEMPPMVGPLLSDAELAGSRKLPTIGDLAVVEPVVEPVAKPAAEPVVEPVAEPVMKPVVESELPSEIGLPTNALPAAPAIEPTIAPPSEPDVPSLSSIGGLFPANPPSVEGMATASNDTAQSNLSMIERSIKELEKSIQVYDSGATESAAILFRALEAFGEQLAGVPESSPERAEWASKGSEVCQTIIANRDILTRLGLIIDSGDSTELFPGERVEYRAHLINIDLVKVSGSEKGTTEDKWQVASRRRKSLELRPLIVSHSHGFPSEPEKEIGFLVLGESEVDPDSRQPVERSVLVLPIR